jgi:hypothetical protein
VGARAHVMSFALRFKALEVLNRHGLMPWPQSDGPQCAVDGSGRKGIVGSRDPARESSYYEQRRVSNGLDPLDTMKKHAVERFFHGNRRCFILNVYIQPADLHLHPLQRLRVSETILPPHLIHNLHNKQTLRQGTPLRLQPPVSYSPRTGIGFVEHPMPISGNGEGSFLRDDNRMLLSGHRLWMQF